MTNKPTIPERVVLWDDRKYLTAGECPVGETISIPVRGEYIGYEVVFCSGTTSGHLCSSGFIPYDIMEHFCAVGRDGTSLVSNEIYLDPKNQKLQFLGGYDNTAGKLDTTKMLPRRIYGFK